MPPSFKACCVSVALCMALSACTGSSKSASGSVVGNASGNLPGTSQTLGLGANMVPVADTNSTTGPQLQDPITLADSGSTGAGVDCNQQLPCEWVSADAQISLTVSNAANIATRSRLSIQLSMQPLHDTDILLSHVGDALDSTGKSYKHTDHQLNAASSSLVQDVLAGTPIEATLNFNETAIGRTVFEWSIEFMDAGMLRNATFRNIPVGTVTTHQADCQNTLPCIWTNPQRDVAIELQTVGEMSPSDGLTASFSVTTADEVSVALDDGSMAAGSDNTLFESRSHELGGTNDYRQISTIALAVTPVYGSVTFYRTEAVPMELDVISLTLFKEQPVPRWDPQFINVPTE